MKCCCNKDNAQSCGCRKMMPVILLILVVLAGYGAYKFMNKPDERTATERVSDAIRQLPNGIDAASKELGDKSQAQKIGDGLKDIIAKE